ncbi:MAG: PilZ domain-containing protein [Treponemataceae bacterium]
MKALLVVDADAAYKLVSFYLKPLGFELIRYRSPVKAMDNLDEIDPDAVIISAEDFPRHWKTIVQFIRSERNKEKTTIVILKGPNFTFEEAAKAVQVGVNGIASDDFDDPEELERLQDILGRYRPIRNGRTSHRVRPADWDRVEFILSVPATGAIATGRVTSLSDSGLAFKPDDPDCMKGIEPGTEFADCSLRVGASILSPGCRLIRSKPTFAFTFSQIPENERTSLAAYIQERPLRQRRMHG